MFASKDAGESADPEGDHAAARTVLVCLVYGMEVLSRRTRVGIAVYVYERTNLFVEGEYECGRVATISRGNQCPKMTESWLSATVGT